MSHEFNTPLNAILSYAEMVKEEMEEDDVSSYIADLDRIHHSGLDLKNVLNGILQVISVESNSLQVTLQTFPFKQLMDDVQALIEPQIAINNNSMKVEYAEEIGEIMSDFAKLQKILFHLLDNAAKFTKDGTITILISKVHHDNQDWVNIVIQDTGIGIAEEELDIVFKVFTQADSSVTREYGGLGIGLTIVKAFGDLLGGKLKLESKQNQGTTVYYEFPADGIQPEEGLWWPQSIDLTVDCDYFTSWQ